MINKIQILKLKEMLIKEGRVIKLDGFDKVVFVG